MKDRLVAIRKHIGGNKKISQSSFAELLGTTRNAIASYELGKVVPNDTFIQLLCSKFDVNEQWLRTGEGEMFEELDRDEAIVTWAAKLARDDDNNGFAKRLATLLASLNEKEWEILEEKARYLFDKEEKKD